MNGRNEIRFNFSVSLSDLLEIYKSNFGFKMEENHPTSHTEFVCLRVDNAISAFLEAHSDDMESIKPTGHHLATWVRSVPENQRFHEAEFMYLGDAFQEAFFQMADKVFAVVMSSGQAAETRYGTLIAWQESRVVKMHNSEETFLIGPKQSLSMRLWMFEKLIQHFGADHVLTVELVYHLT